MKYKPSKAQKLAGEHLDKHKEAALFMGCGLGKTAVVLHKVHDLISDGAMRSALVVAPLRVCNLTWPSEAKKWDKARDLRIVSLRTEEGWKALKHGDAHIYLLNYDQLQQFMERYLYKRRTIAFDTVIWDELTRAKNHKSKRINAVRPYFRNHCERHWGMTGTPVPNGYLDLFAQVRLLDGGERLGKSYNMFKETYFYPTDYMRYNWKLKQGADEIIHQRLENFALTLRSSDYLGIPDVVQTDHECILPDSVKEQYETLTHQLLLVLDNNAEVLGTNAAVLVNKLLQLTSGAVYDTEHAWHDVHNTKLTLLLKLLYRLRDRPVLLAYQYQHELERFRATVPGLVAFSDATTEAQQTALVERWNSRRIKVLAAHPKSMAHGLNLQEGGSTVVWYTLPWSREDYDQLNARLNRRGQTSVTEVHRLLVKGTVDDVVAEALREKNQVQTSLLQALKIWSENICFTKNKKCF